jgi:bifunctional DNase/RNase
MANEVVPVSIKGVEPTSSGCAVFLGNDAKVFVIYVDHAIGSVLQLSLKGVRRERPLTHELIGSILLGLGASLDHVVINDVNEGTFFARLLLRMENELGRKIVELDARPSDSMVLALQGKRPILVAKKVFDAVEDASEVLERVQKRRAQLEADEGDEADEEAEDEPEVEESGEEGGEGGEGLEDDDSK